MKINKLVKIHRDNLLDTLLVFSYFIAPESLFFEFVDNLQHKKCANCNHDVGTDLLFEMIRMFGGTAIKIPHPCELEAYKYLILNSEHAQNILNRTGKQSLIMAIKRTVVVPPEVDLTPIVERFCKIVDIKKENRPCPIKLI